MEVAPFASSLRTSSGSFDILYKRMALATDQVTSTSPLLALPRISAGRIGLGVLLLIALPCVLTLPWSMERYTLSVIEASQLKIGEELSQAPSIEHPMGTDVIGRSLLWRCLLGGAISLGIGLSAAFISVVIGVTWGAMSGLAGGRVDATMMRIVDILYGVPYILLVVLMRLALQPGAKNMLMLWRIDAQLADRMASILTLLVAIGGVSWLTMARVIRGQVLSLRAQPFVEAARASGVGPLRILRVHLLPNLVGPIVVYTTLTVPTAILQESFLSFLGLGVQLPLPSWGNLATEGVKQLQTLSVPGADFFWWLPLWPCLLLGMTLMALNFLGDALRNRLDPRTIARR